MFLGQTPRGVRRNNARELKVFTLSVEGVLRIDEDGSVQTYIFVAEASQPQITDLQSREVQGEVVNSDLNIIQGWIPFDRVEEIAALEFVQRVQTPGYVYTHTGSVTTEGDQILRADLVRNSRGITGAGVISDGVDSRATAQGTGDLPGAIEIDPLRPGSGDEGTAMLEIIHDLAPDAAFAFSGPGTSLEMIESVNYLASQAFGGADADIIVDDLGLFDQPFFEDGPVAQAVDGVISAGTIYVSSAGNSGETHFEGHYLAGADDFHNYGGGDVTMSVTVEGGGTMRVFLQWNDAFGASAQDYDVYACTPGSTPIALASGGICFGSNALQDGNDDPSEAFFVTRSASTPGDLDIFIDGFWASAVRRLEMHVLGPVTVNEHNVPGGSIFGHAAVPGAIAVGAIDASDPGNDDAEPFSSRGPVDIYFPSFTSRAKPDVAAIDGVSVTGVGGFPSPFFGTSAAAPHVAGVAALVLETARRMNPDFSKVNAATLVRDNILNTAEDLGDPGRDSIFGEGRTEALYAVDATAGAPSIEQAKLTASDAWPGDFFGVSVSVSGESVAVGGSGDDDNGTNSGSAYVFVRSGTAWSQQQKLTASDGAANNEFGYSVAIEGDTMIVGAPKAGSAYVFVRTGTRYPQKVCKQSGGVPSV